MSKAPKRKTSKPNRPINYIFSLVVSSLLLYVVNRIPDWHLPFVLDSYQQILLAANVSLGVQAAFSLVLIFYHPLFQHYLANSITSAVAIYAFTVFLSVFPFDFAAIYSPWLDTVVRILFVLSLIASVLGCVVNFVRFLAAFRRQVEAHKR